MCGLSVSLCRCHGYEAVYRGTHLTAATQERSEAQSMCSLMSALPEIT